MTADLLAGRQNLDTMAAPPCLRCGERPRLGNLTRCKVCLRADADQYRQQRDLRAQAAHAETTSKPCRTCGTVKPLERFQVCKGRPTKDGRRRDCKTCVEHGSTPILPPPTPERRAAINRCHAKPEQRERRRLAMNVGRALSAHARLHNALLAGKLKRSAACQIKGCNSTRIIAHHHNYQPRRPPRDPRKDGAIGWLRSAVSRARRSGSTTR